MIGTREPQIDTRSETWKAVLTWIAQERNTHNQAIRVEGTAERVRDGCAAKLALLDELEAMATPKAYQSSDPPEGTSDAVD